MPPRPVTRLLTSTTRSAPNSASHTALAKRLSTFRAEPGHVADWGNATSPDLKHATLALFNAVATGDVPGVWLAVHAGACLNARLKPSVLQAVRDRETRQVVPALTTPLAIAWWNQTHDDEGRAVMGAARDDDAVPDLGMVEAVLTAGAAAESNLLRQAQGNSWEHHPAFVMLERAVLDRLASSNGHDIPVPTKAIPGVPGVMPANRAHGPHLWVHRAVVHGHWAALNAWCDRGGIVGTLITDRLLPLLWGGTPLTDPVPPEGPFADQDAVHAAIARVRPALLASDTVVYRHEVMGVMGKLALPLTLHLAHPVHGPAAMRALGWLVDLIEERPMNLSFAAADVQHLGAVTGPRVQDLARTVEDLLLHRLAHREVPEMIIERARSRL